MIKLVNKEADLTGLQAEAFGSRSARKIPSLKPVAGEDGLRQCR